MKNVLLYVLSASLLSGGIGAHAQGPSHNDLLSTLFTPKEQQELGLQKLSASERKALGDLFEIMLSSSSLGDSAVEYLKEEGWEEVRVIGTRSLNLDGWDDKEYVIVEEGAWTYILEPRSYSTLRPGRYLGDMGLTSCEIIDSDGDTVGFWTKDKR